MSGNVYLETITDFKSVSKGQQVESNCLSISFVNKGTNACNINGLELAQGESFAVDQTSGCLDRTKYQVSFTGIGTNALQVTRILPKNQS